MEAHPLTDNQKNVFFLEQKYPGTSMHHISLETWADSRIDFAQLDAAIHHVVRQHPAVRLQLRREQDGVRQFIAPFRRIRIPMFDASGQAPGTDERALRHFIRHFASQPFALMESDLFRFAFLKSEDGRDGFLMAVHHIAFDGWSSTRFFNLIWQAYEQLATGSPLTAEADAAEPFAFVERERQYYLSRRFERDELFWRNQMESFPHDTLEFAESGHVEGARISVDLSEEESRHLQSFMEKSGASPNELLLAAVYLAASRCFNRKHIVFGVPLFGRTGKHKDAMGFYMNTVPVQIGEADETLLPQLLERIRSRLRQCYKHYQYPQHRAKAGARRTFQIVVNYYNMQPTSDGQHISLDNHYIYAGEQFYPLQIIMRQWKSDRFTLDADYQTGLFERGQMEQLLTFVMRSLRQWSRSETKRMDEVDVLGEDDLQKWVAQWNDTSTSFATDRCVTEQLAHVASRWPDQTAIADSKQHITYAEFANRVKKLANKLVIHGVGPNEIVAVHIEKSADAFVAFWAVLQVGGAFLPIDTSYPPERIEHILHDSRARLVLINDSTARTETLEAYTVIDIHSAECGDGNALEKRERTAAQPEDLAYVIYTSGTTGKPKGVAVTRRGLANLHGFLQRYFSLGPGDGVLQFASVSFDAAVWEMTMALLSGATLHVPSLDTVRHYRAMESFVNERRITAATLPPAYLSRLNPEAMPGLKVVISAGSAAHPSTIKKWADHTACYNAYGPTETTVCATIWKADKREDRKVVPIGRPIDNTQVYILDRNLRLLPPQFTGELYIGGKGLARGYLHNEALTRTAFIDHPFVPGERLYKTGDLAKWSEDGNIEFVGRADGQIQLRGHRIELEEIESVLLRHEQIGEAAVQVVEWGSSDQLCAYYTSARELAVSDLQSFLRQQLPHYMIPALYMRMDELPLNHNGKPQKDRLPPYRPTEGAEDVAAEADATISLVRNVWADVLQLEPQQIKADDHFFDLGGDSLLLMDMQYKLESELDVRIPVGELFSLPTVRMLAEHVAFARGRSSTAIAGHSLPDECLTNGAVGAGDGVMYEYTVSGLLNDKLRQFCRLVSVQELMLSAYILALSYEREVTVYRRLDRNELGLIRFSPERLEGLEQLASHVAEPSFSHLASLPVHALMEHKRSVNDNGAIFAIFSASGMDDRVKESADLLFHVSVEPECIRLYLYGSEVVSRSFVQSVLRKIVAVLTWIE